MTIFIGVFMFLAISALPACWLYFANYHKNNIPKEISQDSGMYRVKGASKNQDTWVFAHNFWGSISKNLGTRLLILNVLVLAFAFTDNRTIVIVLNLILIAVNLLVYLGACRYLTTELKKVFDENGNRR